MKGRAAGAERARHSSQHVRELESSAGVSAENRDRRHVDDVAKGHHGERFGQHLRDQRA